LRRWRNGVLGHIHRESHGQPIAGCCPGCRSGQTEPAVRQRRGIGRSGTDPGAGPTPSAALAEDTRPVRRKPDVPSATPPAFWHFELRHEFLALRPSANRWSDDERHGIPITEALQAVPASARKPSLFRRRPPKPRIPGGERLDVGTDWFDDRTTAGNPFLSIMDLAVRMPQPAEPVPVCGSGGRDLCTLGTSRCALG